MLYRQVLANLKAAHKASVTGTGAKHKKDTRLPNTPLTPDMFKVCGLRVGTWPADNVCQRDREIPHWNNGKNKIDVDGSKN